jgi:hypothetical protein
MGVDKNSTQEFGLSTQFHPDTSTSFSCQVHIATGVLLNLGARHNQQPPETRSGKQHDPTTGNQNRSGRFLKPVRPVSETGQTNYLGLSLSTGTRNQSGWFGKPVRQVLSRKTPKRLPDQNCPKIPQQPLLL